VGSALPVRFRQEEEEMMFSIFLGSWKWESLLLTNLFFWRSSICCSCGITAFSQKASGTTDVILPHVGEMNTVLVARS